MKRLLCLMVIAIFASLGWARAQTPPAAPDFAAFSKKWQTAVAKDDKEAIANMTALPFWWGESLDRAAFLKAYPKIFDAKTKLCFKKERAHEDGPFQNYFCGRLMFRFGVLDGAWRLLEAADND